jgi:transcriptional regulator with XRE-family HTH domain
VCVVNRKLPLPPDETPEQAARLARVLKTLRRRRGLTTAEVARRMNLKQRTYELFEAGGGKLKLDRIQAFAEATDTDPYAILLSLVFEDDRFALGCADHKLMTAAMMSLQDFSREAGEDLPRLDARLVMHEFDAACGRLLQEARRRRFPEEKS